MIGTGFFFFGDTPPSSPKGSETGITNRHFGGWKFWRMIWGISYFGGSFGGYKFQVQYWTIICVLNILSLKIAHSQNYPLKFFSPQNCSTLKLSPKISIPQVIPQNFFIPQVIPQSIPHPPKFWKKTPGGITRENPVSYLGLFVADGLRP